MPTIASGRDLVHGVSVLGTGGEELMRLAGEQVGITANHLVICARGRRRYTSKCSDGEVNKKLVN